MSQQENPVDVDMFTKLQTETEVQNAPEFAKNESAAFVRKCLHPPSAIANYNGLPTNDTRSQVCVEWRNISILKTPLVVVSDKLAAYTGNSLDYALLVPTGARVNSIGFVYDPSVSQMYQDGNGVDIQENYDFNDWSDDANLYRPAYKSVTTYLNATAFNNTGMVVASQFNPSLLFSGTASELLETKPSIYYKIIAQKIKLGQIKVLNTLNREQAINWDKIPNYHRVELLKHLGLNANVSLDMGPDFNIQIINLGKLGTAGTEPSGTSTDISVPTPSQILAYSARSYGGKAQEGTFTVNRLNTIAPAWLPASRAGTTSDLATLYECWYASYSTDASGHFVQYNDNATIGTAVASLKPLYDTLWSSDMTWTWIRYQGLTVNPIFGTAMTTNTQLLIKKYYCGFEIQPSPMSAWAGMNRLSSKPDLGAMQGLMDAYFNLKDAFPAHYNSWGVIGQLAMSALKDIGSQLLSGFLGNGKQTEKAAEEVEGKPTKAIKARKSKASRREQIIRAAPRRTRVLSTKKQPATKGEYKSLSDRFTSLEKQLKSMSIKPNNRSGGRSNNNKSKPRK